MEPESIQLQSLRAQRSNLPLTGDPSPPVQDDIRVQKPPHTYLDLFLDPDPRIPLWLRIVGGAALPFAPLLLLAGCSNVPVRRKPVGVQAVYENLEKAELHYTLAQIVVDRDRYSGFGDYYNLITDESGDIDLAELRRDKKDELKERYELDIDKHTDEQLAEIFRLAHYLDVYAGKRPSIRWGGASFRLDLTWAREIIGGYRTLDTFVSSRIFYESQAEESIGQWRIRGTQSARAGTRILNDIYKDQVTDISKLFNVLRSSGDEPNLDSLGRISLRCHSRAAFIDAVGQEVPDVRRLVSFASHRDIDAQVKVHRVWEHEGRSISNIRLFVEKLKEEEGREDMTEGKIVAALVKAALLASGRVNKGFSIYSGSIPTTSMVPGIDYGAFSSAGAEAKAAVQAVRAIEAATAERKKADTVPAEWNQMVSALRDLIAELNKKHESQIHFGRVGKLSDSILTNSSIINAPDS